MKYFKKNILNNTFLFSILLAVISVITIYFIWGFYYEEYQSKFVALLSGVVTPGFVYTNLYYMAYLSGLASVYAHLSSWLPTLPVFDMISYGINALCLAVFIYLFIKTFKKDRYLYIVLCVLLLAEFFILSNVTRDSVLILSSSIALFFYIQWKDYSLLSREGILCILLWILGLLTRLETTITVLTVVLPIAFYYYIFYLPSHKRRSFIAVLSFFLVSMFAMFFYIMFQLQTSKEFYLQIEPDFENELMIKENYIPISSMENKRDSVRYLAIKNAFYADAKTNNATFVKSLINTKNSGILVWRGKQVYIDSLFDFVYQFKSYLVVSFLLMTLLLFKRASKTKLEFLCFILCVFITPFALFSIYVQWKDTSRLTCSVLMASSTLWFLLENFRNKNLKLDRVEKVIFIYSSIFILLFNYQILSDNSKTHLNSMKNIINRIDSFETSQTLALSGVYSDAVFESFKPFDNFTTIRGKSIFIFDDTYTNVARPYKTYLEQTLNIDPEDFPVLIETIKEYDKSALWLITPKRREFIEMYLKEVHSDFQKLPQ